MEFREATRLSWTNIRSHKLRNVLAILSVTIGIAAVIAVVTMSSGFQKALLDNLTGDVLRANTITISIEGSQGLFGDTRVFTARDVEHVRGMKNVKAADVIAPVNGNPIKFNGQIVPDGNVRIVTSESIVPLGHGKFVDEPGEIVLGYGAAQSVCERLLGSKGEDSEAGSSDNSTNGKGKTAEERCEGLSENEELAQRVLDQTVSLTYIDIDGNVHRDETLDVVGIEEDSQFSQGNASYVTEHYQGYTETINGEQVPVYGGLIVSAADVDQLQSTVERVKSYFNSFNSDARKLLGEGQAIQANTLDDIVGEIESQFNQFTTWIGAVAVIALLVGMIGVINIMLITVKERTREIGVMKATGATQGGVLRLFLTEAVFICAMGAIFGIVVGIGLAELFNRFTASVLNFDGQIPLVLVWSWYAIAVVTGIVVGIVSGIYPAWQAARVNPIEALRYE
ncbi:MAG: ABC transporter permease [Candidatus Bipolaricaulia bacterium]